MTARSQWHDKLIAEGIRIGLIRAEEAADAETILGRYKESLIERARRELDAIIARKEDHEETD
jgi:hypothetical protein